MCTPETIKQIFKWANKKRIKYQDDYQLSGSASAMKTWEKYEDICDICNAAEQGLSEEDVLRKRMRSNQRAVLEQFKDMKKVTPANKTFTFDDVESWMRKMMV